MCVKVIPSLLRKNSVFGKEVVVFQVLITFSKDLYIAIHDKLHVTCISEFQVVRYYYTKTFVSFIESPIFKLYEEHQCYTEPFHPPSKVCCYSPRVKFTWSKVYHEEGFLYCNT